MNAKNAANSDLEFDTLTVIFNFKGSKFRVTIRGNDFTDISEIKPAINAMYESVIIKDILHTKFPVEMLAMCENICIGMRNYFDYFKEGFNLVHRNFPTTAFDIMSKHFDEREESRSLWYFLVHMNHDEFAKNVRALINIKKGIRE